MAALAQPVHRPVVVLVLKQLAFAEPVVKVDTDSAQVLADYGYHLLPGQVAYAANRGRVVHFQVAISLGLNYVGRDVGDVVALIAIVRQLGLPTQGLLIPNPHRPVKCLHLRAGIVDVIFAGNVVSRRCQRVRQRAAQHGAAGVPHMHRPSRVDADKLDHHLAALANLCRAERVSSASHRLNLLLQPAIAEPEIDEPGRRRRHAGNLRPGFHPHGDSLGQLQRIGAGGPRQA